MNLIFDQLRCLVVVLGLGSGCGSLRESRWWLMLLGVGVEREDYVVRGGCREGRDCIGDDGGDDGGAFDERVEELRNAQDIKPDDPLVEEVEEEGKYSHDGQVGLENRGGGRVGKVEGGVDHSGDGRGKGGDKVRQRGKHMDVLPGPHRNDREDDEPDSCSSLEGKDGPCGPNTRVEGRSGVSVKTGSE